MGIEETLASADGDDMVPMDATETAEEMEYFCCCCCGVNRAWSGGYLVERDNRILKKEVKARKTTWRYPSVRSWGSRCQNDHGHDCLTNEIPTEVVLGMDACGSERAKMKTFHESGHDRNAGDEDGESRSGSTHDIHHCGAQSHDQHGY